MSIECHDISISGQCEQKISVLGPLGCSGWLPGTLTNSTVFDEFTKKVLVSLGHIECGYRVRLQ